MSTEKKIERKSGSFSYNNTDELVNAWMENQSTKSVSVLLAVQEYVKLHGVGDVLDTKESDLDPVMDIDSILSYVRRLELLLDQKDDFIEHLLDQAKNQE